MKTRKMIIAGLGVLMALTAKAQKSPEEKLNMAMYAITNMYVDSVDKAKLVDGEIARVLRTLDPFSEYLPPMTAKANEDAILGTSSPIVSPQTVPSAATKGQEPVAPSTVKCFYMANKTTGYLCLSMFAETTPEDIRKALAELRKEGMKDLILDLQNNGGGLFDAAVEVADEFLDGDKLIVSTKGAHIPGETFRAHTKGMMEKGRLVLLVGENTKSAAEIFSAAIRDWDRGVLVGNTTFGKGLIQQTLPFSDGSALRITVARYLTPCGMSIQKPYNGVSLCDSTIQWTSMLNHRPLVCRGGVEADVKVMDDAAHLTDWCALLTISGVQTVVADKYVNDLRERLLKKYPTTDSFTRNFETPTEVMKVLCQTAEGAGIPTNQADYAKSEARLKAQMKAVICSKLYQDKNLYYKLFNADNNVVRRAMEIIGSKEYDLILQRK